MKIVVDVFGGDYAPDEILKGCADALKIEKDVELALFGGAETINKKLAALNVDMKRVGVFDASDIITNDDIPTDAIKNKKDSSLVRALEYLKNDGDAKAVISSGNTGAFLAGGLFKVGRIKGVSRPALAPVLPNAKGGFTMLIDCGANVDCKPLFLCHFALMGSAYMQSVYGLESPRVALLSNGTEDKKGNELNRTVFPLLKKLPINFVGNMEARDALSGEYDVLVSDGFAGNIALKSTEGAVNFLFKALKGAMNKSLKTKLGAVLLKKELYKMKKELDYTELGGAPFLGVEKILIKNHGSAKANTVAASITQAKRLAEKDIVGAIKKRLEGVEIETSE